MITQCTYVDKMKHIHLVYWYTLLPGIVSQVLVCYISSIFLQDIIFMTKEILLAFSNQVLLQDYSWKC